jgi:AcrR family transcriptional regulator
VARRKSSEDRTVAPPAAARMIQGTTERSLRLRKKARQRAELITIAIERFRQQGYELTRIEDIAEAAEVSTKTVYNYFPTKQKILLELLTVDRLRLRTAYEKVLSDPPTDPAEGLARLIHADIGDVQTMADKRLWRELMSAETRSHARAGDEFEQNRRIFTHYIEKLLRCYQSRGALRKDLPLSVTVNLVYALNAYDFREYCALESMRPVDVLQLARQQMKVVVNGWRGNDTITTTRRRSATETPARSH